MSRARGGRGCRSGDGYSVQPPGPFPGSHGCSLPSVSCSGLGCHGLSLAPGPPGRRCPLYSLEAGQRQAMDSWRMLSDGGEGGEDFPREYFPLLLPKAPFAYPSPTPMSVWLQSNPEMPLAKKTWGWRRTWQWIKQQQPVLVMWSHWIRWWSTGQHRCNKQKKDWSFTQRTKTSGHTGFLGCLFVWFCFSLYFFLLLAQYLSTTITNF